MAQHLIEVRISFEYGHRLIHLGNESERCPFFVPLFGVSF